LSIDRLEAQQKAVADYLNGGRWSLVEEYTEVETGKRKDRPELAKALAACRLHKATLVIAKLDRLARNVAFTAALMDSGVEFVAVDFPQANRLTVHILAAVAEHEAEAISTRTKAALAAAKRRGVKLGNPENLTDKAREKGRRASIEARRARAADRAKDVLPAIEKARAGGATSLRQIAAALNTQGITTPRGKQWSAPQVRTVLARS
jgi:DNA invertase Pin-like site-specific DNA recombinase